MKKPRFRVAFSKDPFSIHPSSQFATYLWIARAGAFISSCPRR